MSIRLPATEFWLIRHGVTEWNRARRFQGHLDIGLHADGHRQAQQLADGVLARLAGARFGGIYSSDLMRARDTAGPMAARLGIEVRSDPSLRERCYGAFQACTHDEARALDPGAYLHWRRRTPDFVLPGNGESLLAFQARCVAAFERLAERHPGERIGIVSHGGVLDIGYRLATGLALDAPRAHPLLNASINRIGFGDGGWSLVDWGDVAHLDDSADDSETQQSVGTRQDGIAGAGAGR